MAAVVPMGAILLAVVSLGEQGEVTLAVSRKVLELSL